MANCRVFKLAKSSEDSRMVRYVNTFCCSKQPSNFEIPCPCLWFIRVVIVESLLLLSLSIGLFVDHAALTGEVYGILGVYCVFLSLFFGLDSVVSENKFQFVAFHLIQVVLSSFIGLQTFRNHAALGPFWESIRFKVLGIRALFQLGYLVAAPVVWRSFGFYAFKVVGGSVPLIRMFDRRRALLSMLKLDTAISVLLLLLVKAYLLNDVNPALAVCSAFLASSLLFAACLYRATVAESRKLTLFSLIFLAPAQPLFVSVSLWNLYLHQDELPMSVTYPQFAVIGLSAVFSRAVVCSLAAYGLRFDFGKGLRSIIEDAERQAPVLVWRIPCRARMLAKGGSGTDSGSLYDGGKEHPLLRLNEEEVEGGQGHGLSPLAVWLGRGRGGKGSGSSGAQSLNDSSPDPPDSIPVRVFKRWAVLMVPYDSRTQEEGGAGFATSVPVTAKKTGLLGLFSTSSASVSKASVPTHDTGYAYDEAGAVQAHMDAEAQEHWLVGVGSGAHKGPETLEMATSPRSAFGPRVGQGRAPLTPTQKPGPVSTQAHAAALRASLLQSSMQEEEGRGIGNGNSKGRGGPSQPRR